MVETRYSVAIRSTCEGRPVVRRYRLHRCYIGGSGRYRGAHVVPHMCIGGPCHHRSKCALPGLATETFRSFAKIYGSYWSVPTRMPRGWKSILHPGSNALGVMVRT